MKHVSIFLLMCTVIIVSAFSLAGKKYKTSSGVVSFFSETPLENISAKSETMVSVIDPATNQLAFSVTNKTFTFKNALMQEHFNEKYMESEKYPKSTFSGKINETVDLTKDGTYKVTATGKLNVHGVEQPRTVSGTITVTNGKLNLKSEFTVKVADHKIEIPKLVFEKIAEEIKVTINSDYTLQ